MKKRILFFCLALLLCAGSAQAQYSQPGHGGAPTSSAKMLDSPSNQATINGYSIPRVLCQSSVPSAIYNATGWASNPGTTWYILGTCSVPAGAMGLNGQLRIKANYSFSSSANTKYAEMYFGGSASTFYLSPTAGYVQGAIQNTIGNQNSASAQVITWDYLAAVQGTAITTLALDTTAAQDITFRGYTSVEAGVAQTGLTGNGSTCTATVASGAYATGDMIIVASGTGCGSGTQNTGATPVSATNTNTTHYTYPCTCNGGTPVSGSGQRYSRVQLESYCVELIPGAN